MVRIGITSAIALSVAAAPSVAQAAEGAPCSAGRAKPQIVLVDRGAGSGLVATHEFGLRLTQAGAAPAVEFRSVQAPGARVDTQNAEPFAALLWVDRPGPLTVTVTAADQDPGLDPGKTGRDTTCTHTVSQTFTVGAAAKSRATKLKRPFLVDRARRLWYRRVTYSFSVVSEGARADLSPFTVRVRATRRGKFPGARTRAVSQAFGLRSFDTAEEDPFIRGCGQGALVCAPTRGSYSKGPDVYAFDRKGGLRILVEVPTSYPNRVLGRRAVPTPWGVDVEVLQSGRRVARLRAAGRCTQGGQAAKCTFKKASTKL